MLQTSTGMLIRRNKALWVAIDVEEQQCNKYGLRSDTTPSTNCLERISKKELKTVPSGWHS